MPTQIIVVPTEVLAALGGQATEHDIVIIREQALRLGLLLLESGGRYLVPNKDLCCTVGITLGQ